jgi:hypothetical protein
LQLRATTGHHSPARTIRFVLAASLLISLVLLVGLSLSSRGLNPSASPSRSLTYSPVNPPLLVNITPNVTAIDLTQVLTLTAVVSGGSGVSSNWGYVWTGLPPGCTTSNSSVFTCTPTSNGTYNVGVTVTDSVTHQMTSSAPAAVGVNPDPTVFQFTSSAGSNITTGYNFTLSVLMSNGTSPFSYSYTGLFASCTGVKNATVVCKAGSPGNYTFGVTATDAVGWASTASLNLTVTPVPTPVNSTSNITTTHGGPGTVTYAEMGAILGVGALIAVGLVVKARRDERQTFRAVPSRGAGPPTLSGGTTPSLSSSSETKPMTEETGPGGKSG